MSADESNRTRPQRIRKASKRHADSVQWTEETMQILRASSESSDRSSTSEESEIPHDDGDIMFEDVAAENMEEGGEEEDVDHDQVSEGATQRESPAQTIQTPKSVRGKIGKHSSLEKKTASVNSRVQLGRASKASFATKGVRNRMVPDGREIIRGITDGIYQQNYGPSVEDLYHVLQARDIWHVAPRDVTLPSRQSLSSALGKLPKGYLRPKTQATDAQSDRDSPTASHSTRILEPRPISLGQALQNSFVERGPACNVVLGPWSSAQKFTLHYLKPLDISAAWARSQLDTSLVGTSDTRDTCHKAWLINIGARPHCMGWSYSTSNDQFLAVSFKCSQAQRATASRATTKLAPAFSASPRYPSSIQIWQTKGTSTAMDDTPTQIDFNTAPALSQVLCVAWGNILRFEWVTMLPDDFTEDQSIRSLALLTSDGCIRLIDVNLQANKDTTYVAYDVAKHVLAPQSTTIFTAFCFASKYDIITGAADGAIRIYNLASSKTCDETTKPYLIHQVVTNYIMAVAVSPELPYYVCTSSAGGDLVLTDLRSPDIDKIMIHKARHPTRNLSYLPFIRTFVTTNDAAGNSEPGGTAQCAVISHSIRHFQYTNAIMKLPDASGLTTSLATSPFHPCLLVANAQGSVFATNHLRRYLPVAHASSSWMQKIFDYDWQPVAPVSSGTEQTEMMPAYSFVPVPNTASPKDLSHIFHGRDLRPGISRIHEGFRPERVDFSVQSKQARRAANASLASTQVVFHEEQAVAAMAWNPNPRFAGWAAVAWGSGLLRIQDLSHNVC